MLQSKPMSGTYPMLRSVLKSQYHASLAMLREAIERCPPEEWLSTDHKNAFWQLSYHTLFFAHTRPAPSAHSPATVCRKDTLCKVQLSDVASAWRHAPAPRCWLNSLSRIGGRYLGPTPVFSAI